MRLACLPFLLTSLFPLAAFAGDSSPIFLESTYRVAVGSALPPVAATPTPIPTPGGAPLTVQTTAIAPASAAFPALGPEVSVGVGSIILRSEAGSASFSAATHFAANPIVVDGTKVSVRLVDSNVDTDYTISGTVTDSVTPGGARDVGGLYYLGSGLETGGLVLGTGAVVLGYAVKTPAIRNIGTGIFVLVPIGVLIQHQKARKALIKESTFRRNLVADLTLRRSGKTVKKFLIKVDDTLLVPLPDQPEELRQKVLAPLWNGLSREIAQQINQDLHATAARE